ncbi:MULTISPECIES: LysR family transcriptional regulator [unclassified Halomonas]|uniref:LysR family transcriptional regulator n=1 Tax=unclassified Halomonas TaxID=2609666 RepID=UPI001EF4976A|nr:MULTISPECIES: LysR family transcriptional regulator [unclassified Halomonas]MCG7590286.1 LysR family transcriptional regulator [Halomonas sp. McD50-5]MCG7616398.1 LysR family transcriptional regulator [Halomonas sp. McD50-4]
MDNSIRLLTLRLFVRVAVSGSFSEAARYFGVPTSSASRHIASLERALGQRLLYRHTRAVKLTEAGERYFHEVRDALARLELATEQVMGGAQHPQGVLRINAPVAFGRRHIAPHLARFQQQYPGIQVELTLEDRFIDPVQEGADVVIRVGALADSSLVARGIARQRFVVCASPEYLATHGSPASPEALSQHNCLLYRGSKGTQSWYFQERGSPRAIRYALSGNLVANNAESLVEAAIAGQGVVMFPSWLLFEPLRQQTLVPLLTQWEASEDGYLDNIYAIYPENRLRSSKVSVFMAYLGRTIGNVPYWDAGSKM